jgi:hypothetical protein
MTEAEWLAGTWPSWLLRHFGRKASSRKLRLFAVACGRRAWEQMRDETCRRAVEVAERHADRQASNRERDGIARAVAALCDPREIDHRYLAYQVVRGTRYTSVMASCAANHAVVVVTGHFNPASPASEAERAAQCRLLRDVFGNPFRPMAVAAAWLAWNGGTAPKLAQAVYDERAFERLPVLADALEEAGCTDPDLLGHCRQPGEHVRGCWAVDLLLGKS